MTDDQADRIIKDLEMLRKLAILDMYDKGYSQGDIADVLGVSQPTISRMFPKGLPKRKTSSDE
jgi:predicted transcriptional regulator